MLRLVSKSISVRPVTIIRKHEIVRAKKNTIYEVVANVDKYKTFVPYCADSTMDDGRTRGTLVVNLGPVSHTWTSSLTCTENEIVAKNATSYPVKFLNTRWEFAERKNGLTLVDVEIEYELATGLSAFESVISDFSHQFVSAFKLQAEKIERQRRKS